MGVYRIEDYFLYFLILALFYFSFVKFILPKIKIDKNFLLSVLPFIFFGVFIRVLADMSFFPRDKFWSITPGVYIFTFIVAMLSLTLGKIFGKNKRNLSLMIPFSIGLLLSLFLLSYILPHVKNPEITLLGFFLAFTITFLVFFISKILKILSFQKSENFAIIFAHMLDGSSTFIAYNFFGFEEEHLLPRFLISLTGDAFIMVPIKLFLILAFLYLIENYENSEEKKLIKLIVFIFGIGPGLRNAMLLSLE